MNNHSTIELLRQRINNFEHNEGYLPKIRISKAFWQQYAHEIADLSNDGITINVVDEIKGRHSFLLEKASEKSPTIDTLLDLKKQVDKWFQEGKGHWPVRCMGMHADIYIPIQLYAVVPGETSLEGIDLQKDFWQAPEGEHILVITGD